MIFQHRGMKNLRFTSESRNHSGRLIMSAPLPIQVRNGVSGIRAVGKRLKAPQNRD
jgi:hypothetical protein